MLPSMLEHWGFAVFFVHADCASSLPETNEGLAHFVPGLSPPYLLSQGRVLSD